MSESAEIKINGEGKQKIPYQKKNKNCII